MHFEIVHKIDFEFHDNFNPYIFPEYFGDICCEFLPESLEDSKYFGNKKFNWAQYDLAHCLK